MKKKALRKLPNIGENPHQPDRSFEFPKRDFSGRKRNFQHEWFTKFSWLHYDEAQDKAYCFICVKSMKENLCPKNFSNSEAFTYHGFDYWNKAFERFKMHEESKEHKDSRILLQKAPQVDEILDFQCVTQRATNRKCLIKII